MKSKNYIWYLFYFMTFLIVVQSTTSIFSISEGIFSIDLRNRIIGSRLLFSENKNVYFDKDSINEYYIDPLANYHIKQNRVTVSPSYLILIKPLINLNYTKIIALWSYLNFLIWIIIGIYFFKYYQSNFFLFCLFILSSLPSAGFFAHQLAGQNYLIYTLICLFIFYGFDQSKYLLAYFFIGILIALRFNFAIALFPFLSIYRHHLRYFWITVFSFVLIIALSCIPQGIQVWFDYFEANSYWSTYQISTILKNNIIETRAIEGYIFGPNTPDLNNSILHVHNMSIQRLFNDYLNLKIKTIHLVSLLIAFTTTYYLIFKAKFKQFSPIELFINGCLLYIISSYFLPAPRLNYNFVEVFIPLAYCIFHFWNKSTLILKIVLIIGIFLNFQFIEVSSMDASIGELSIITFCFIGFYTKK